MLFFKKKTPEEQEKEYLEKMRRAEKNRGFLGCMMQPVDELLLGDVAVIRFDPDYERLLITCERRKKEIPYTALCGIVVASEHEIARGESAITMEEVNVLLAAGADQMIGDVGEMDEKRARWFIRIDYEENGEMEKMLTFLYGARGPYMSRSKMLGAIQCEETMQDVMSRYRTALPQE